MNMMIGKLETGLTAALWLAAALLLPLAALTPLDASGSSGGAEANFRAAATICFGSMLDTVRACPGTAL